ncbi:diacylglycerol O-acyltransferase 1 [Bemisia tabaci]|uniref:diacylglycerol O-acyltransferase 1 n=1 Tax=Bemisia tabaci TaxID=7038 RepID=UPI0008F9854D|nr:PREDICTED: diacylglycerol O-acyltransferase 1-like [Bemisia tabaci]
MPPRPEEENFIRRRAKSVTQAEEIQQIEAKVRHSQPDKPCHKPRDSLFSWASGFRNFSGLINWAFLLLFMGSVRLFLENLIKYGIRVDPQQWFTVLLDDAAGRHHHFHPSLILLIFTSVPVMFCLLIEKGLHQEVIPNRVGMTAHVVNLMVLVLTPIVALQLYPSYFSLVGASVVCFAYSVIFLKLWSYVHVNSWCREDYQLNTVNKTNVRRQSLSVNKYALSNGKKPPISPPSLNSLVHYPQNLNIRDISYFILAPTLCYELNFPRTDRIRKRFLVKRVLELLVGMQVMASLFQQWIIPCVKNSLIPFSNMDVAKATERLLKLAIPNHLLWLIFFYLMFHSALNVVGELLHFADRNFYSDWWNANNIDTFWRNWNFPVHQWAVRHLYCPLLKLGFKRGSATFFVFFTSAFFHEYMVSVPLRTFKVYAFMGMMFQIPLSVLCHKIEKKFGPPWGNIIVWSSLIMSHPLCIMTYYHDYIITHFGKRLLEEFSSL